MTVNAPPHATPDTPTDLAVPPDGSAPVDGPPEEGTGRSRARVVLDRSAVLIAFVAMIAIFWAIKPDVFGTWPNARSILDQAAVILILGAGLTLVLATGEFDLSFPGAITVSGVVMAKLLQSGSSPLIASLVGIAVAIAALSLAGVLVAMQRTSSLIVTLALNTLWGGVAAGMSNEGVPIPILNDKFNNLAITQPLGLPLAVYLAAGVVVLFGVILRFTVFGRRAEAIGTNPVAARFAGIPIARVRVGAFALLGLCAGIAAVILTARQGQFTTNLSLGLFIPPFVAAFFGISVLAVGKFNMFGTVIGALFIGTLQTGLIISGAAAWTGDVVVGAVLIITLFAAAQRRTGDG
jgi:ribose/xylose/arabinose/galactoside ABC-type transport system permease subunit